MSASPQDQGSFPGPRSGLNRRRLVAGTAVAGIAGAGIFRIARAQDDAGTPDATTDQTPSGTPEAATEQDTVADETTFATAALTRADDVIASVQADRDAVASDIDTAGIDSLIAQAGIHRDLASSAIDASDNAEAIRQAFVATAAARSARQLMLTNLGYPGLPSQEARASRILANVHELIAAVTAEAASATDPNVEFFVTDAQTLYTTAYDLYGTGAYAQAIGAGHASGELARIATVLMADISQVGVFRGGRERGRIGDGPFGIVVGGGRRNDHGKFGLPGMPGPPGDDEITGPLVPFEPFGPEDDQSDSDSTPVPVPAPDF